MFRTAAAVLAAALGLAALPASAFAATRKVPSEQYPTIQSAINGVQSGDVILVASGTYSENLTISGNNPFTLKGKGYVVIDGDVGPCISLSGVQDVTITGFLLSNADDGVLVTACHRIVLDRLFIPAPNNAGIHIRNGSSEVTVSRCTVSGSVEEGLLDEETDNLVVSKCRFTNTGLAGVALSPNYVTDGSTGSDNALVEKCTISTPGAIGIHWGGNNVLLSKNRISGSGSIGIFNDPSTTTLGSTVEKNRVTGAGDEGICISGSSNTLSKNSVTNAQGNGIQVEGQGNTIERNRIRAPNLSGIVATGSGGHTLDRNSVVAADIYGISVQTTGNVLTGNRASGNGEFDLHDDYPEGTNTYDRNRFGTTFFAIL